MSGFQPFPLLLLIIPGTMLLGALWRMLTGVVELLRGRTVRANPWVAEQHTVDRSGMIVDVLYDRDRPERFIAPQNGRALSAARPLTRIGLSLVFLVFIVFLLSRVLPIVGGVDGILQMF